MTRKRFSAMTRERFSAMTRERFSAITRERFSAITREPSWLGRSLGAVATTSARHPRSVLALAAVITALALGLAATHLTLETSNLDLIDPNLPPVQRFLDFSTQFGTPNLLVVVLEGGAADIRRSADRLAPALRRAPGVEHVFDRLPIDPAAAEIIGIDPYFATDDGGMAFLFVQPTDTRASAEALDPFVAGVEAVLARELTDQTVTAGLTGMPRYALDDRDVIQRDIARLSLVSLVLVLALFLAAFARLRHPLAVMAALLIGVGSSLGVAALYPGHLTLLSAFFASILFGLGVDSGIHIVSRAEELIAVGVPPSDATPQAITALAPGLVASTLTTASMFWVMRWSGFRGFEELGLIAGCGILACLATMVTILPALLALGRATHRRPLQVVQHRVVRRRRGRLLISLQNRHAALFLAGVAILAPLAGLPVFDTDYLNLQPADSETVRLEREMVRRSDWSPAFAAFTAESRNDLQDLVWNLVNDDTVGAVRSVLDIEPLILGLEPDEAAGLLTGLKSPDGHFAVYAYPQGDIWNLAEQQAFIEHMLTIDPQATGMPLLGSFMVERSKRALVITATAGIPFLFLWVFLVFRDLRWALLAMLPTLLTVSAVAGLMKLFGLSFNPLNVMALPVVLGIAVDDGIHLVHRFLTENGDRAKTLAGAGRSILLTSATTLAAFGALSFTSHRGLASFAQILSLGVAVALVLSLVVLPELLRLAWSRDTAKDQATIRN